MIGSLDPTNKKIAVIGGGIAGLLAAYVFDKKGYEVTLHEASDRFGGLIATLETADGMVEKAAHSIFATLPVIELCSDLGVELVDVNEDSKSRYVLKRHQMRKWPLSPWQTLCAFCRAYFVRSKRGLVIVTLEDWALRFVGKPALDYFLTPFVRGIYGASPADLTISAAMPRLKIPLGHSLVSYQLAKLFRPSLRVKKHKGRMVAPRFGMEDLVRKLEARLSQRLGARLKKNSKLLSLPPDSNVILCVPARNASVLLEAESPVLSQKLNKVPYTPLVTVTVFALVSEFERAPKGVGVLVPEVEPSECLGILFTSSSFSNRIKNGSAKISLTVILGGSSRPEIVNWPDSKIATTVENELRSILGYRGKNPAMIITKHENAIPVYGLNLEEVWRSAQETWCSKPGRMLFGNYTGQVSIRGMIESLSRL